MSPCDGRDINAGWKGVVCDASSERVVHVYLAGLLVAGELLPFFGRLGALLYLDLEYNPALRGDVADLAGATPVLTLKARLLYERLSRGSPD